MIIKMIKFVECEVVHDKMVDRAECYINPAHVVYIEEHEEYKGYTFIGLVNGTTIVKGSIEEIKNKLEGKRWLKIIHRQ